MPENFTFHTRYLTEGIAYAIESNDIMVGADYYFTMKDNIWRCEIMTWQAPGYTLLQDASNHPEAFND
jgi:hypothetical protein